jgi:hypothetical protein
MAIFRGLDAGRHQGAQPDRGRHQVFPDRRSNAARGEPVLRARGLRVVPDGLSRGHGLRPEAAQSGHISHPCIRGSLSSFPVTGRSLRIVCGPSNCVLQPDMRDSPSNSPVCGRGRAAVSACSSRFLRLGPPFLCWAPRVCGCRRWLRRLGLAGSVAGDAAGRPLADDAEGDLPCEGTHVLCRRCLFWLHLRMTAPHMTTGRHSTQNTSHRAVFLTSAPVSAPLPSRRRCLTPDTPSHAKTRSATMIAPTELTAVVPLSRHSCSRAAEQISGRRMVDLLLCLACKDGDPSGDPLKCC